MHTLSHIRRHQPLPLAAAAALLGCWADSWAGRLWLLAAALLLAACLRKQAPLFLLGVFVCFWLRSSLFFGPMAALPFSSKPLTFDAVVCQLPPSGGQTRVLMRTRSFGWPVMLRLAGDWPLSPGDRVRLTGRLVPAQGARNPGGFDSARWYRSQGWAGDVCPVSRQAVQVLSPGHSRERGFLSLNQTIRQRLQAQLPAASAGLLLALVTGQGDQLPQADRLAIQQAGLAHLTAVSGLHVLCLLGPVRWLLEKLGWHFRIRLLVQLLVLVGFGCLTGWPLSVVRAVIMTGWHLAGRLFLRPVSRLHTGALAFLCLLAWRPGAFLQAGFWLSFTATAAVLGPAPLLARKLGRLLPAPLGFLSRPLAAGCCAQWASLPWLMLFYGQVNGLALVTNLLAGPLIQLVLSACLLTAPLWLPGCPAFLSSLVFKGLNVGLALFLNLSRETARFRWLSVSSRQVWLWLPLFVAGLLLWLWHRKSLPPAAVTGRLLACLAVCVVLLQLTVFRPIDAFWAFDVGQGDALLLCSQNRALLVDGGNPGQGYQVLVPALDRLGFKRVAALASHAHDDHTGGLLDLVNLGRISRLLIPDGCLEAGPDAAALQVLVARCRELGVPVQTVTARDTITLTRSLVIEVLDPPLTAEQVRQGAADGNAWSLILLARFPGGRVLLTGDCTPQAEQRLLQARLWPRADVLKVAHHGAGLTTTSDLLQAVSPQLAVISVGSRNPYGHPAPALLARCQAAACTITRTDKQGAVRIRFKAGRLSVQTAVEEEDHGATDPARTQLQ